MSSASKSRKQRRSHSRAVVPEVTGKELLVVDQAPYLKKALSTCKRLRNELHKKQAVLNDFEEHDRKAFQLWYHGTHGATLTQLRELREELNAYEFLYHHLSHCAYHAFADVPKLYDELMERKKNGTLYEFVPPNRFTSTDHEDPDDEDWDEEDDWDDDEDDESMEDFFEKVFGRRDRSAFSGEDKTRAASAPKAEHDARLKTCYRGLAKRLHPDHSELEESIREKRWFEIQDAYQNSDLDALLRVEAVCDMDDTGLTIKLGLARLRDLAAYHQSHLQPLRNALRAAKQDIAFGFSKKGPSPRMEREVAEDLKDERLDMSDMLGHLRQAAAELRDEVEDHLREQAIRAAQAARTLERRKARRAAEPTQREKAKPKARSAAQVKTKKPSSESQDERQMSFF